MNTFWIDLMIEMPESGAVQEVAFALRGVNV
jgi:hypothetical protein